MLLTYCIDDASFNDVNAKLPADDVAVTHAAPPDDTTLLSLVGEVVLNMRSMIKPIARQKETLQTSVQYPYLFR